MIQLTDEQRDSIIKSVLSTEDGMFTLLQTIAMDIESAKKEFEAERYNHLTEEGLQWVRAFIRYLEDDRRKTVLD